MALRKWPTTRRLWERIKPAARAMRAAPTEAERLLWASLRRKQLGGLAFRRQHPLGRFIADFYCPRVHLVIEIDGGIHRDRQGADAERERHLSDAGLSVLRFSNEQVLSDRDAVLRAIAERIDELDRSDGESLDSER